MKNTEKRLTYCLAENWKAGTIRNLEISGDSLYLDVRKHISGMILLPCVDSCENGFLWKRVIIDAEIPKESALAIYAYATENKNDEVIQKVSSALKDSSIRYAGVLKIMQEEMGAPLSSGQDCLVLKKGRYLWLAIVVLSGGKIKPRINRVTFRMAGDHMIDYLPAIYQGNEVTRRFLSIFNSIYTDMDEQIDALPSILDYENNSEELLRFFAGWIGLNGKDIPEKVLRKYLPHTLDDYGDMYTVSGIRRSIRRILGRDAIVLEPFEVDPNSEKCPDPELYRKLFTDDPYCFYVLVDEDVFETREEMDEFQTEMENLIPAGISMRVIPLKKNIRLGIHSYLGINAAVGDYENISLNENKSINFDTMIGGTNGE